jgi:hypothetical protein
VQPRLTPPALTRLAVRPALRPVLMPGTVRGR